MLFNVDSKGYFRGMQLLYKRINSGFGNLNQTDCTNKMLWTNANVSFWNDLISALVILKCIHHNAKNSRRLPAGNTTLASDSAKC